MIEDEELKDIYRLSSLERLQNLETGILQLEQAPEQLDIIEDLLREAHSLKGDSRVVGVNTMEAVTHALESVLSKIQSREIALTSQLSDRLYQTLDGMQRLVNEALTGEPSGVDVDLLVSLLAPTATESDDLRVDVTLPVQSVEPTRVSVIEDEELQEIYRISSQERLQSLETGIIQLEQAPEQLDIIEDLLREAHSLKGDSRVVGVNTMEAVTHALESVLSKIQSREIALTSQLSDRLYQTLDGMQRLVNEALTGEPSGVDVDLLVSLLAPTATESDDLRVDVTLPVQSVEPTRVSVIEDEELQEIYRISSQERLQSLETGIIQLEQAPEQLDIIEDLLREAHSLKGDSRVVGVNTMEAVTHALESVLSKIQSREIALTSQLSDRLYQTLDGMQRLVNEALTGEPSGVDTSKIVEQLTQITEQTAPNHETQSVSSSVINSEVIIEPVESEQSSLTHQPRTNELVQQSAALLTTNNQQRDSLVKSADEIAVFPTKIEQPYRIDTVRVATTALDELVTQASELIVSKTRMAHTVAEIEQISNLWKKLRAAGFKTESGEETETVAFSLEQKIEQLKTLTQENSNKLEFVTVELENKIANLRQLPLSQIFQLFPRLVRDLAKEQGKQVRLVIQGGDTQVDKKILEEIKDPLMHLIRNAIDHGIETPEERMQVGKTAQATVSLQGYQAGNKIMVELQDDGRGLNIEKIKKTAIRKGLYQAEELESMSIGQIHSLIFHPGFSTRNFVTEVSGRGVGMDVVKNNIEKLKGIIEIDSTPNQGSTFSLRLPTTLAKSNVLLLEVHGIVHAIPIDFVEANLLIDPQQIFPLEGKDTITINGKAVSVASLADLLEITNSPAYTMAAQITENQTPEQLCILMKVGEERFALIVDRLVDITDVAYKPQSNILRRVRNVSGATILGTGQVCIILSPVDLLQSLKQSNFSLQSKMLPQLGQKNASTSVNLTNSGQYKILLVEDSILVRTQEKRLLEAADYEVVTAVDGLDGYNKLRNSDFDAVISDVEMPNLDGISLTKRIRQHHEYAELPIILVTSLATDEDKRKGAEAGANAYIVKGQFNQDILLDTLDRLI